VTDPARPGACAPPDAEWRAPPEVAEPLAAAVTAEDVALANFVEAGARAVAGTFRDSITKAPRGQRAHVVRVGMIPTLRQLGLRDEAVALAAACDALDVAECDYDVAAERYRAIVGGSVHVSLDASPHHLLVPKNRKNRKNRKKRPRT